MKLQYYVIKYPPKLAARRPYEAYATLRKHNVGDPLTGLAEVVSKESNKSEAEARANDLNQIVQVMES